MTLDDGGSMESESKGEGLTTPRRLALDMLTNLFLVGGTLLVHQVKKWFGDDGPPMMTTAMLNTSELTLACGFLGNLVVAIDQLAKRIAGTGLWQTTRNIRIVWPTKANVVQTLIVGLIATAALLSFALITHLIGRGWLLLPGALGLAWLLIVVAAWQKDNSQLLWLRTPLIVAGLMLTVSVVWVQLNEPPTDPKPSVASALDPTRNEPRFRFPAELRRHASAALPRYTPSVIEDGGSFLPNVMTGIAHQLIETTVQLGTTLASDRILDLMVFRR